MSDYLEFVKDSIQTLLERQSARLGGRPDGMPCITVTKQSSKTYRSVSKGPDGIYRSGLVTEQPLEPTPYRLDLRIWPVLDLFSEVTGDAQYRQMAVEMASAFGRYGFESASGLGYLGNTAEFDVLRLQPVAVSSQAEPLFKPDVYVPVDRLWAEAPDRVARMLKSVYYGLITRPETLDYNRYCHYGYDDRLKKPSMAFNSGHVAFATTGAMLIHWWGSHFARTGDAECLAWAQAMADKWGAVQHSESGLIPHWFGGRRDEPTMPPQPTASSDETPAAISLLRAADELKKRPEGAALAEQVSGVARRLLRGMARHSYDPAERVFPQWLHLDGRVREETVVYTFRTQADKDEAVRQDPVLQEVAVFAGSGFYAAGPWCVGVQNACPYNVALGACLLGDADLLARAQALAADVMEEAGKLTGAFNAQGQWTYPASASYIKMMILLSDLTKERRYLDQARKLADMELDFLSRPAPAGEPEWWRMPFRGDLLEALLLLHRALVRSERTGR
ncbi:MAG: hypothetical protein EXS64_06915 [Candidatus Latescibacteria bacterium]|nr:hypothetical protein [Candidatus Latescibacterota bacterium]